MGGTAGVEEPEERGPGARTSDFVLARGTTTSVDHWSRETAGRGRPYICHLVEGHASCSQWNGVTINPKDRITSFLFAVVDR